MHSNNFNVVIPCFPAMSTEAEVRLEGLPLDHPDREDLQLTIEVVKACESLRVQSMDALPVQRLLKLVGMVQDFCIQLPLQHKHQICKKVPLSRTY